MSEPKVTFAMLQERFVTGLERRLLQLNENLTALRDGHDAAEIARTADEMMRGFHSLAGIGGTYGFPRITEIARRGELECNSLHAPIAGEHFMTISDLLSSLAAAAAAATDAIQGQTQKSALPRPAIESVDRG